MEGLTGGVLAGMLQRSRDRFLGWPFLVRFQVIFWVVYGIGSLPIHFAGMRYAAGWTASFAGVMAYLLTNVVYEAGVTTLLGKFYERPAIRRLGVARTIVTVFCISLVVVLAHRWIVAPYVIRPLFMGLGEFRRPEPERSVLRMIGNFWLFLFYLGWSTIYLLARASEASAARKERLRQEEAKRQAAELGMLRSQINPHFLFNAMNSIAGESDGNSQIDRLVEGLSGYLRYGLASSGRPLVEFREEVRATEQYLEVEKARFGDSLRVEIDIAPEAEGLMVPGILLQPLVENAVKHGRETAGEMLTVRIRAAHRGGELSIRVGNTGQWKESSPVAGRPSGIGLANVRERLALLYPGRADFSIGPEGDEVVATIRIRRPEELPAV